MLEQQLVFMISTKEVPQIIHYLLPLPGQLGSETENRYIVAQAGVILSTQFFKIKNISQQLCGFSADGDATLGRHSLQPLDNPDIIAQQGNFILVIVIVVNNDSVCMDPRTSKNRCSG